MKWIPQQERLPTGVDADADGYVFIRFPAGERASFTGDWVGQRVKWYVLLPIDCEWLSGAFQPQDNLSTGRE